MAAPESVPAGVRRRARAEIIDRIVDAARRQLETEGAAGVSLRAVARELGMASSAVYRYVEGRDDLLTLLIIDAYDALGSAAESAESVVPRDDFGGRWLALCHGVRDWALRHPHEYTLIFGSPVPGYVAPQDTVGPATRVTDLLTGILGDAGAARRAAMPPPAPASTAEPVEPEWAVALRPVRSFGAQNAPAEGLLAGLVAWTFLFGTVSFELFGHYHGVIDESPSLRRAFFTQECSRIGLLAGLSIAP